MFRLKYKHSQQRRQDNNETSAQSPKGSYAKVHKQEVWNNRDEEQWSFFQNLIIFIFA